MARILLGVSGGIAAYKALEFIRLATAAGHSVRVLQTPTSQRFVGGASFAALTGAPVLTSEFERDPTRGAFPEQQAPAHDPMSHLELVRNAEVYLIAPASANTLAKLAHGLADNLVSSCALAADCPLVVAPAMNNHMYEHAATQANIQTLRDRGVQIVDPERGALASKGEYGTGRMAQPARLLDACEHALAAAERPNETQSWRGLRVLVTAGGTREPIDSVRFIGNSSSGRMGLALARAAQARGAQVTVIAANIGLPPPAQLNWLQAPTAAALLKACEHQFPDCDVLLMTAAVADFRPSAPAQGKIKKDRAKLLELQLERTEDVLSLLAARRREGQVIVGFAAEHGEQALQFARRKRAEKDLDAIVVNDISRADIGFDSEDNEVTIITRSGEQRIARAPKTQIAEAILDAVQALRAPAVGEL